MNRFAPLAVALLALITSPAFAQGTVVVTVSQSEAIDRNADTIFGTMQDPYPHIGFLGGPMADGPILNGKDDASWAPGGFLLSKTIPITDRTLNVHLDLFDDDDTSPDDPFDINPGVPVSLDLTFDTCVMESVAPGLSEPVGGRHGEAWVLGAGTNPARIRFNVATIDGNPFTQNDLAIRSTSAVQSVFNPSRIIAGKPLVFRVDLANTYPIPHTTNVTVTLKDHTPGGDRSETRNVTVPPAGLTVYFFDGSAGPFYTPQRDAGNPTLEYSVALDLVETPPAGTDPKFLSCYADNNHIDGRHLPIIETQDPFVVYRAWDWTAPVGTAPASLPDFPTLSAFRTREEQFRLATWPLAALNPRNRADSASYVVPAAGFPFGPFVLPSATFALVEQGTLASIAGIDRLVLVTRQGWFAENAAAGALLPDWAVGLTPNEEVPHAVLAEVAYFDVAIHELGHTYGLSKHSCSNGGLAEKWLANGCRDEYAYAPGDGAPFQAYGYDVAGAIYPTGARSALPFTPCPPSTTASREVCVVNFMDRTGFSYGNWIDNLAFESLATDLKTPGDPELINLSGWVHTNGGLESGVEPQVFDGGLLYSYHFDGSPDKAQPPLSFPTDGSGPFSGGGPFAIRLNTGQGNRTYRFAPSFTLEGLHDEYAFFSFNVPWEPNVQQIELYAPTDIGKLECEFPPCLTNADQIISGRVRTPLAPTVTTLRAGLDNPPSLAGPQPEPPTIGPGHDVVLAWDPSDPDSADLHSAIVIDKAPGSGGPRGWTPMHIDIVGNTLRIGHNALSVDPGEYIARVAVSDGVNGFTYTSPDKVFRICNLTNGGVEICDSLDNDCNGLVDEMPLALSVDVGALTWTPQCGLPAFDVAFGKLADLPLHGDFSGAVCLGDSLSGITMPFTDTPAVGEGYWFLVRVSGETWNDGTEVVSRDLSLTACP